MFNPKYRLLITTKSFPLDQNICLGNQLISIVNFLKDLLPPHIWYGADVDAVGIGARRLNINGSQINVIGSDQQLIQYCSEVDQFIWGEFLCIDKNCFSENRQSIELETEEPPFRSISCMGILVEIRMFDTTYIEIYSEDEAIIRKLAENFFDSELTFKI